MRHDSPSWFLFFVGLLGAGCSSNVDGDPDEPVTGKQGGVAVVNTLRAEGPGGSASASYVTSPLCPEVAREGGCLVQSCSGQAFEPAGAGTITITGGLREIVLVPEQDFYLESLDTPAFDAGQSIHFDVAGDIVPAHAIDVVGPAAFDLLEPDLGALVIDRTTDLHVAWTPAAGTATVTVAYHEDTLNCQADADAGSLTVPASLLALLPATTQGVFVAYNSNVVTAELDGWALSATALAEGTSSSSEDGGATAGNVTLE